MGRKADPAAGDPASANAKDAGAGQGAVPGAAEGGPDAEPPEASGAAGGGAATDAPGGVEEGAPAPASPEPPAMPDFPRRVPAEGVPAEGVPVPEEVLADLARWMGLDPAAVLAARLYRGRVVCVTADGRKHSRDLPR